MLSYHSEDKDLGDSAAEMYYIVDTGTLAETSLASVACRTDWNGCQPSHLLRINFCRIVTDMENCIVAYLFH